MAANFNKIDSNLSSVPEPEANQCSREDSQIASVSEPECPIPPSSSALGLFEKLLSFSPRFLSGAAKLFSPAEPLFVSVFGSPVYFGNVNLYSALPKPFAITNNSDTDIRVQLSTTAPFTVDSGGLIKARQTGNFVVVFRPTRPGNFSGSISGNHGISIYLTGTGVDPFKK